MGGKRSDARRAERSRSHGRGGRGATKAEEKTGKPLPEWGSAGVIQELKASGIGFIRPHKGKVDDKDLFFHTSAVKNCRFDDLSIGDEVTYEAILDESKGRPCAKTVTVAGKPARGRDESRDASRDR